MHLTQIIYLKKTLSPFTNFHLLKYLRHHSSHWHGRRRNHHHHQRLLADSDLGMSLSLTNPGMKRKRADSGPQGLTDDDRAILSVIKSKRDSGIWVRDLKFETKLTDHVVNRSLKSLTAKNLIKEVVNIQKKGKKHYMAQEFEPSRELTGGEWYADGKLDKELIDVLKMICARHLNVNKVATLEGIHNEIKKRRCVNFDISTQQVGEIINSMILDSDVIEVKSTGLGDYRLIPIGTVCYRVASGLGVSKGAKTGAFASIPCGACPRIDMCTPDGVISPTTCVYYKKWLGIDF